MAELPRWATHSPTRRVRSRRLVPAILVAICMVTAIVILFLHPNTANILSTPASNIHVKGAGTDDEKPRQVIEMRGLRLGAPFEIPQQRQQQQQQLDDTSQVGTADATEHALQTVLDTMRARIESITEGKAVFPDCPLNVSRYMSTAIEPQSTLPIESSRGRSTYPSQAQTPSREATVSFAINLYNSEEILPSQAMALLSTVGHLIKRNKIYVSVFENSSTDKTRAMMSNLAAGLQALGADGVFFHSSKFATSKDFDRIVGLAEIRNSALIPLIPFATSSSSSSSSSSHESSSSSDAAAAAAAPQTLVFMNDIGTCPSSILELIHQQRFHSADMAFGMDWDIIYRGEPKVALRPYDMWTLRDLAGQMLFAWGEGYSPQTPSGDYVRDAWSASDAKFGGKRVDADNGGDSENNSDGNSDDAAAAAAPWTEKESTYERWKAGRAFPVYSGWGGMAAFNASLFTHDHLRFRATKLAGWEGGSLLFSSPTDTDAGASTGTETGTGTGAETGTGTGTEDGMGAWGALVGNPAYLDTDCPGASECKLIARDIWNLRGGKARIVLAPQANSWYGINDWEVVAKFAPMAKRGPDQELDLELDRIPWEDGVDAPDLVTCIPTRDKDGKWKDPWGNENKKQQLPPLLQIAQT